MFRKMAVFSVTSLLAGLLTWSDSLVSAADLASLAGSRPNIILIMPDDMGWGDIAAHGNPLIQTPNLDRLHAESVRFTDFHVSPTCAPTRSALMTGRHEFKNGVTHTIFERERLTLKATTLAQVLKSAGYTTGIFGKWHLGDEEPYQPNRRGFDETFIHGAGGIGQTYAGSCGDAPNNKYFNPAIRHNGTFVKTTGYCTDVFFGQAMKWIEAKHREQAPFFAYITPNAPHGPLVSPGPQYDQRYAGKEINGKKLAESDVAYYSMISNIDENIGRLLAELKQLGIDNDTLLIFLSDNGGTHTKLYSGGFRGGKGTMYTGGTHAPSFWRWTGFLEGGRDSSALSAHLDVLPTLAEIAGAKLDDATKQQIEGRSLVPLLVNPQAEWPDRTLVTHVGRWEKGQAARSKHVNASIRNKRFRLVADKELYDLQNDPGETTNVFDQHPEVVADLRTAYNTWWDSVQPMLVNENAVGPKLNPYKELYWKQFGGGPDETRAAPARPNVLFCIADDASPHLGAYGCQWVKTPNIDRVARAGLVFQNAYTPTAKCAPSRAAILTGRNPWQLEEAANHQPFFPVKFKAFTEVLRDAGIAVGSQGKTWGPGAAKNADGSPRDFGMTKGKPNPENPGAPFREFLEAREKGQPFFYWFGSSNPHRAYQPDAGTAAGKKTTDIDRVPAFWPDSDVVRRDMLDYAIEVEAYDAQVGSLLKALEESGELDNTLVIVTSDHGMPFPRVKGHNYDMANRVPLIARWPNGIANPGRTVTDFVSLIDLAPTLLELFGVAGETSGMASITGRSLSDLLQAKSEHRRPFVILGRERNDVQARPGTPFGLGYPVRGIREANLLYLRNFAPDRWPCGDADLGLKDTDASPTKKLIEELGESDHYWQLCYGKRPAEELFDLATDPDCVKNLAEETSMQAKKSAMHDQLMTELQRQRDPRVLGQGDIFDHYPSAKNLGVKNPATGAAAATPKTLKTPAKKARKKS